MVLVLGVIVVFGIMASKGGQREQVVDEVVEKRDVFEGLDRTETVTRKAPKDVGFSGKSFESESTEWVTAQEIQARAAELHAESNKLREDGDSDWRKTGKEAKELYEDALEMGRAYRAIFAGEYGETTTKTKRLDKTINTWNRTLMGLHKTIGA